MTYILYVFLWTSHVGVTFNPVHYSSLEACNFAKESIEKRYDDWRPKTLCIGVKK